MKKISLYFAIGLAAMFSLCSCEDFLDVNKSPDNPTTITAEQVLPTLTFYLAQAQYDHAEYGVYLSQCLTTGGRAQVSVYPYKNGWEFLSVNRHPQWRRHFYDLGVNIFEMTEVAKKTDSRNFALIGRTMKLYSTLLTTDAFGDIPLEESYGHIPSLKKYWTDNSYTNTSTIQPKYAPQEHVYEWMYEQIDELIELYEDDAWAKCPTNKRLNASMDRIYGGDIQKWGAFTKALKARMLIRKLPNWENNPAVCQEIIDAVDAALNDPNWEEPLFRYSADGSAEKNCPWGPTQPTCNLGWAQGRANLLTDAIPSKFFGYALLGCYMNTNYAGGPSGYSLDPRATKMFTPRKNKDGNKSLRYIENNIGMGTSMEMVHYPEMYALEGNNPFTRDNGYIALITTEELLFIKAEAQYWLNPNDLTAAYNTTREAVQKSMERYGVAAADASSSDREAQRHQLFLDVRLPGASELTIADIMQQKYVAMYLQSEQWTDVRRYNYSCHDNGIKYNGVEVYTVKKCHNENDLKKKFKEEHFRSTFSLRRPYNLYEAYWNTAKDFGNEATLSPNAWIQRLNYDPECEDKYNREQLESLGAFRNPDWLRKRMIWAMKNNDKVSSEGIEWE